MLCVLYFISSYIVTFFNGLTFFNGTYKQEYEKTRVHVSVFCNYLYLNKKMLSLIFLSNSDAWIRNIDGIFAYNLYAITQRYILSLSLLALFHKLKKQQMSQARCREHMSLWRTYSWLNTRHRASMYNLCRRSIYARPVI